MTVYNEEIASATAPNQTVPSSSQAANFFEQETFKCFPIPGGYLTPYPGTHEVGHKNWVETGVIIFQKEEKLYGTVL